MDSVSENEDWKQLFIFKLRALAGAAAAATLLSLESPVKYEGFQAFLVDLNKLLRLAGSGELVCPPEVAESFANVELVPVFSLLQFVIKDLTAHHPEPFLIISSEPSLLYKIVEIVLLPDINSTSLMELLEFMKDFKTLQAETAAPVASGDFGNVLHEAVRQIILRTDTLGQFDLYRRFEMLFVSDPKETKYKMFKRIVERICYEVEGSNQILKMRTHYISEKENMYWGKLETLRDKYGEWLAKVLKQLDSNAKGKPTTPDVEKFKKVRSAMREVHKMLQVKPDKLKKNFSYSTDKLVAAERDLKAWQKQMKEESSRRKEPPVISLLDV